MKAGGLTSILIGALAVGGCDSNVEPFLDSFAPPIHVVDGFLDGASTEQQIRVQKLRQTRTLPDAALNEFTVTSTVGGTGTESAWRDSLIMLDDGSRGHVFLASLSPTAGTEFWLKVSDADGETVFRTTVPGQPPVTRAAPILSPTVIQPTRLVGLRERPPELAVTYAVTEPETAAQHRFSFPYVTPGRVQSDGWEFDIFLTSDRNRIGSALGRDQSDTTLVLNSVSVDFELLSTEWAMLGSDTQPAGFFGSIGDYAIDIPLDATIRERLNVQ